MVLGTGVDIRRNTELTMRFKLGRLPPRHTLRTTRGALAFAKAYAPLGKPPVVSSDYAAAVTRQTGGNWGMDGNAEEGDCTIADSAHQIMLHTANAGSMITPTSAECSSLYFRLTGGPDSGLSETVVCDAMQSIGLVGQKSAGSGMLDPANLDHIRWTVQIFGACRLGIFVNDRMQREFESGQPWTRAATPGDSGYCGHDVPIVRYDAEYAYVVTWAKIQPVAWSLVGQSAFLEEAHAEVWPDFCRVGGTAPSRFNLDGLLTELAWVVA